MPLLIPDRKGVTSALQGYVRSELPELDPTVTTRRGWIGGMVKSLASALHDWYVTLKRYGDREPFPQTATGQFLFQGWWKDITGLDRNPASPARGTIVITGTHGTTLPTGATLASGNAGFTTDASAAVVTQSLLLSSLTRSGSTAIAETVADTHHLASGMSITIAGATPSDYNGVHTITATAANEFTFSLGTLTPASPASGTITASGTWGTVAITADDTGLSGNVDAGASLAITNAPVGIDSAGLVTFGGIAGGSEIEDPEVYRTRVLEALGTDFGEFSAAEIKIVAKQVPGVTRVWVREAELYVEGSPTPDVVEGQVKIAFMRDGDADPFPSATEVAAVKTHIVGAILPAHTAEEDVAVISPTRAAVDFTFSAISPDTASMRLAIRASLEQFFQEGVDFGVDVTEDDYRCAIKAAYDMERRQALKSFTLSTPTGDVSVGADDLPVLGEIVWPT